MQPYQRTRARREKTASVTGVVATLGIHALGLVVLLTSGLKYLDPPPPERTSLVIQFDEDALPSAPVITRVGQEPQAEEIDLEREVELVQKAESPQVNDAPNETPATQPDAHGDVEVPTPPQEPKLDPRASFPGMSPKESDATTPHSASEASEEFKAGQPDGNTPEGRTEGSANAQVEGRTVMGTLHKPEYNFQKSGVVVVQIKVDQYGNVVEAIPGAVGTNVADKDLWNAARNAAMKTTFNQSANAPVLQIGTITYNFKFITK